MPVVVQCSNCGKKLKMKEPTPGKKLRCPGCKEPFVPKSNRRTRASGGVKKKKRPVPVDDFSDDFADEDFGEDEDFDQPPQPSRGKKSGGKKGAKSGKGKKATSKKSKAPLFIGVGVIGLALAGGVAFLLMPGGEENDAPAIAGGSGQSGASGVDMAQADPAMAAAAGGDADTGEAAAAKNTVAAVDAAPANPDLKWLPETTEVFAKLDVQRLLAGPVGELLKNPMLAQQLDGFQQQSGLRMEDIESVIFGMTGVSAAAGGSRAPTPGELPMVAVIRTKVPVQIEKLQSVIPKAMAVNDGSVDFVRISPPGPQDPPLAMWAADSTTVVVTLESLLSTISTATAVPTSPIDGSLLTGTSALRVVFKPADPDKVFRSTPAPTSTTDPAKQPMIDFGQAVQPVMAGFSFDLDITADMLMNGAILTASPTAAEDVTAALKKWIEDIKQLQQNGATGELPAMMQMAMAQGMKALDDIVFAANGNAAEFSYTATGAGQQLAMMGPMLPMMIGGAMSQAQQAIKAAQPRDGLKNISMAMLNFHSLYGRFPNAASTTDSGKPLLSWRVHLLPFLGHEDLYNQFALDEPWDSAANRPLADQMPEIYGTKGMGVEPAKTLYQVIVGPGTAFEDSRGYALPDFTDGSSNTILLVEVAPDRAVTWTQPIDHKFETSQPLQGLGGVAANGFRVAMADGTVKTIASTRSISFVKGIMTRNGGERVQP